MLGGVGASYVPDNRPRLGGPLLPSIVNAATGEVDAASKSK